MTGRPLPAGALWWMSYGEHGLSSETMFFWLVFGVLRPTVSTPSDSHDLRRCRLMIEAVPDLYERLHEMAAVSAVWAATVGAWSELCAIMDHELPGWRKEPGWGPATYTRLTELRLQAQVKAQNGAAC